MTLAVALKRWAFTLVPLVGLVELALHWKQTRDVVPDADWLAAREGVKAELHDRDLVVFAPEWSDPLGRLFFGADIMTLGRAARPDATRFERAFEVSMRGAHSAELSRWKKVAERRYGALTVTTLENPSFVPLKDDLVAQIGAKVVRVSRVDAAGETPCPWQHGVTQSGSTYVPQGPAVPGDKFVCQGSYVGVGVLHDLDHRPRQCIFAGTIPGATLRIRFADVAYGAVLHGHDGVQWVTDRTKAGDSVHISFKAMGQEIGHHTHKPGTGWVGFELPMRELSGQHGELVVEVSARGQGQKQFCFEADTR